MLDAPVCSHTVLADDIGLNVADTDRRLLSSAADTICVMSRTHSNFGGKSFAAAGPPL